MTEITGMIAWGNGEPCPICGKPFKKADTDHLMRHPEAIKILFPESKPLGGKQA